MSIQEYTDHNASQGEAIRRVAAAHKTDRVRMLATLQDRDMGCITLYMSKHELQVRTREAMYLHSGWPQNR